MSTDLATFIDDEANEDRDPMEEVITAASKFVADQVRIYSTALAELR